LASSRQPGPVGTAVPDAISAGTLVRRAPTLPGSVGLSAFDAPDAERALRGRPEVSTTGGWIPFEPESPESGEPANEQSRGLVIIARAAESDAGYRRLEFATPEAAREIAARLAENRTAAAQLSALGGASGNRLADWAARQFHEGGLKVLWRQRERFTLSAAPAAAAPPAPRRTPSPASPSLPTTEYSTFPPGLDALAVAQVLRDAARDGVPFCEECMKARAETDREQAGAA